MPTASTLRPVIWMGDSLDVLREFPAPVQDEVGYALYLAQIRSKHVAAKPLKGFGSGIVEVVSDHRGDTYRTVYTVRFEDLVSARLKRAEALHRKREKQ